MNNEQALQWCNSLGIHTGIGISIYPVAYGRSSPEAARGVLENRRVASCSKQDCSDEVLNACAAVVKYDETGYPQRGSYYTNVLGEEWRIDVRS